tara:strand:- start:87139 stop:88746 length:1608 start_codon:yes stop_codon:yes gene_type:complete
MHNVVLVGSGPTSLYTLAALLAQPAGLAITVIERESQSGTGMPFRPDDTDLVMLSNIASIEIPPICQTFLAWIETLPDEVLGHLGIRQADLHARHFFPRVLLGAYLRSQLGTLAKGAQAAGHDVTILNNAHAVDVVRLGKGYRVTFRQGGNIHAAQADQVVLATGHEWPEDQADTGYYASPWPSAKLRNIPAARVGVLGSSLSGIDTALGIAAAHGQFEDGGTVYQPSPDAAKKLRIVLMSRKGLLPEADFWCELPHLPLDHCTPERLADLAATSYTVDDIFALIREDLAAADPAYARHIGLASLRADDFADAYFADRIDQDPFVLAAANLAEVDKNYQSQTTVPWRYAILRLHEAVAPFVPGLSDAERARFHRAIAPVFIDNYAAVPPQTIRRLLALGKAGVLEVQAIGDTAQIKHLPEKARTQVRWDKTSRSFAYFVDARGQRALNAGDLTFPTLLDQLDLDPDAAVPLDDCFRVSTDKGTWPGIYCASLPFILHRHPFAQGITVSHEIGETLAEAIAAQRATDESRAIPQAG